MRKSGQICEKSKTKLKARRNNLDTAGTNRNKSRHIPKQTITQTVPRSRILSEKYGSYLEQVCRKYRNRWEPLQNNIEHVQKKSRTNSRASLEKTRQVQNKYGNNLETRLDEPKDNLETIQKNSGTHPDDIQNKL